MTDELELQASVYVEPALASAQELPTPKVPYPNLVYTCGSCVHKQHFRCSKTIFIFGGTRTCACGCDEKPRTYGRTKP